MPFEKTFIDLFTVLDFARTDTIYSEKHNSSLVSKSVSG